MWTPRRISLGLSGLVVFAASYFGYARLLGNLDGLPPLPEQFADRGEISRTPGKVLPGNTLIRKLELAFGPGCAETRFPIKVGMKDKEIILASNEFKIINSGPRAGWVELSPLSVAIFGKKLGADGTPEINTLYGDMAYIKCDKPIKSLGDLDGSKVVEAELHADPAAKLSDLRKGRIRVQNNRRTLDLNDDVELVTPGPVYYKDQPNSGEPNVYTFTQVQVIDHLNTGLPVPDRSVPREPTITGEGLRVFLTQDDKDKKKPATRNPKDPVLPIPRKEPRAGLDGIDLIALDHTVEMNLWTDANASFVAPGGDKPAKKDTKPATEPKADPKKTPASEKRLLQIRTNGPFRYDLTKQLAHFEKPAVPRPGVVEDQRVTVTRAGRTNGQDMLDCEYLDVQFQRKKPPATPKDAPPPPAAPAPVAPPKKDSEPGDGDLEIKSIRAWGETVVVTSDSENLHATGAELVHDAEAKMTILKGGAEQQVQAVKDGNTLRGSELHLFGDGKEISQAHVLGAGWIGMGDLDPKSKEYQKQAFWTDRMVYIRHSEKGKPVLDVLTFLGKDGGKAKFRDTSNNQLQEIEAYQLKVELKPPEKEESKDKAPKKAPPKKPDAKKKADDPSEFAKSARPTRMEAIGEVRSNSPDVVIKHTDHLEVFFTDVQQLIKPPEEPKDAQDGKGPAKGSGPKSDAPPAKGDLPAKKDDAKKEDGKKEEQREKKPLVVTARTIKTWINQDPQGRKEIDHVAAEGDVEAHQDPATKDEQGTDIAGQIVEMQAFAEGNRLVVKGVDNAEPAKQKWGVVRFDKLTMFGFDIVIDQRSNTSGIKGEGSMEILAATDMEGKKLEKPTTMTIYWKHKMEFYGTDKLMLYHGAVQAYQEASRLKCEWMQVVLDRPVYLNQAMKPKPPPKKLKPGEKKEDDNPKIDTVMCFHAPKDEDVPKPRSVQPVTVVEEVKENGKVIRFQSIQAPDIVTVNTPIEGGKSRHDITATSSDTMPGTVRIWQPGPKDALADKPELKKDDPKKKDPKKKGELGPDEEMKLTVIQFGGKMIANDLRKRAKFFNNIRVVHLATDSAKAPVDLREGEIPKGAVYLECRDTLDVFTTTQKERDPKSGKEIDVAYQEMIGIGNVRVRKQGEFFGDADRVTYSELKGTLTFHGSDRNPAVVYEQKGPGVKPKEWIAKTVIYNVKTKTFQIEGARQLSQ